MAVLAHDCIRIRGARQNNLRGLDLDMPLRQLVVVTGVSRLGQVVAGLRHGLRRGPAPLRRDVLAVRAAVPRPHGQAAGGPHRGHPARDRHRPDQPGAHLALDRRHDDRAQRSPEAALRARRAAALPRLRPAGAARHAGQHLQRPGGAHGGLGRSAPARHVPGQRARRTSPRRRCCKLLEQQGYTRVHARERRPARGHAGPLPARRASSGPHRRGARGGAARRPRPGERAALGPGTRLPLQRGERSRRADRRAGACRAVWRFSTDLHCADCDIHYRDPTPSLFSFNSPLGACETCRGFGRIIGIDYGLVIPDAGKTLRGGAIKPWQTESYRECQDDLLRFARKRGVPLDAPWRELTDEQRRWVHRRRGPLGEEGLVRRAALLRVARDARATRCTSACCCRSTAATRPARPAAARGSSPRRCCGGSVRAGPAGPGLTIHDVMLLPIDRVPRLLRERSRCPRRSTRPPTCCSARSARGSATSCASGLGYLTLDRQSRTLSGGEVQRINLTTALGTSLVNTLFVLDEPSIGLHPRDMRRVIEVMQRLRDAGNSLLVVEHDPQIMLAADRIVDLGPGPGEHGGRIVFDGTPAELAARSDTLDGAVPRRAASDAGRAAAGRAAAPRTRPRLVVQGATRAQPQGHRRRRSRCSRLVCVTGVTGSGKSTLVQDVLYSGAAARQGQADGSAGRTPRARRRRTRRRRRDGRPVADRPHDALESRELRRRVRRDPQALRAPKPSRSSAATRPARSASTPATAAAPPAAATASSTSRCSSSPTCTCAAPTATARRYPARDRSR